MALLAFDAYFEKFTNESEGKKLSFDVLVNSKKVKSLEFDPSQQLESQCHAIDNSPELFS